MNPTLALIFCSIFVMFLLRIERKQNQEASLALWIPTIWVLIAASRPIGRWFLHSSAESFEAGSPLDRFTISILILFALLVISRRYIDWYNLLKTEFWLILLFLYVLSSILWSDHHFLSLKRCVRLIGVFPVALVILSEQSPIRALESIFRRCTYVLIPFSLILIKYFPQWGRNYSLWSGSLSWSGVSISKNGLAQLCMISIFFIIWDFLQNRRTGNFNKIKLFADGLVLSIAAFMLAGPGSFSATSVSITIIIVTSLLFMYTFKFRANYVSKILISLSVFMWLFLSTGSTFVPKFTSFLGRSATFTGRTAMWNMALEEAARHPILGTGFGNYFGLDNEYSRTMKAKTAHNGLVQVYVELGIIGVALLIVFLLVFYHRFRRQLNHVFDWGVFGICLLVISILNNYTESILLFSGSYIWNSMVFLTVTFQEHVWIKMKIDSSIKQSLVVNPS